MTLRTWVVPLSIILGALGIGVAAHAATTDDKKKGDKGGGKGADKGGAATTTATATVARLVPNGGKIDTKHTGTSDGGQWGQLRFAASVAYLTGIGVDAATAREMSLSALAHWAIETGTGDVTTAGANEFCFNVGGIHAKPGQQYFTSTDAGVTTNFAAYNTADQGVGDYWALLAIDYADCLAKLKADAKSDAWIRCLGQKGYYSSSVDTMASGWKIRRDSYAASIHGYVNGFVDDVADIGDADTKTFGPYDFDKVSHMVQAIRASGATVTGDNPWEVDPGHGIKLHATWDDHTQYVTVNIAKSPMLISNAMIWAKIQPLMP